MSKIPLTHSFSLGVTGIGFVPDGLIRDEFLDSLNLCRDCEYGCLDAPGQMPAGSIAEIIGWEIFSFSYFSRGA